MFQFHCQVCKEKINTTIYFHWQLKAQNQFHWQLKAQTRTEQLPSTWCCSCSPSGIQACIAPAGWPRSGARPPVLGSVSQTVIPERKPPKCYFYHLYEKQDIFTDIPKWPEWHEGQGGKYAIPRKMSNVSSRGCWCGIKEGRAAQTDLNLTAQSSDLLATRHWISYLSFLNIRFIIC